MSRRAAGKYNGQTQTEWNKNYKRLEDIMNKTSNKNKQIALAKTQANRITNEWKAINRAMAAKQMDICTYLMYSLDVLMNWVKFQNKNIVITSYQDY